MKETRYIVNQLVYQSQSVDVKIAKGEREGDCERGESGKDPKEMHI